MGVIASTTYGDVEGAESDGLSVFKGIPFAKPPDGELRYKAPVPPDRWEGLHDASHSRAAAPQIAEAMFPAMSPREIDEDCLYLNVWTPATDGAKRPVMVWIHGGGFLSGAGSLPWYNGTKFAAGHDVVVVTINYRLGPLGFMYLGDLAPSELGADANAGMLDQIAALEWVRDNIESFGGDPANITIFGESAGGMSVGTLLGIPRARGLFHKAILESGAASHSISRHDANVVTERFLELIEVDPEDIQSLRSIEWQKLTAQYERITAFTAKSLLGFLPFLPVVDGDVLPKPPLEAIFDGLSSDVAVMAGTNDNEMNLFALVDPAFAKID